jgi:hypothetical protein
MSRKATKKRNDDAQTKELAGAAEVATVEAPQPSEPAEQVSGEPNDVESGQRPWGNPYKTIITTKDFEMGEHRRFKQRVFKFKEKPDVQILAILKEKGFTYRPDEKSWTIPANPATRVLSDDLAQQFAGSAQDRSR